MQIHGQVINVMTISRSQPIGSIKLISFHRSRDETALWRLSAGWERAPIYDLNRIARGISSYTWSPIFWDMGQRGEQYFDESHWCAFDFDSPDFTLKDAERAFCDSICIVGTTRSHRLTKGAHGPCDRFRVMVPWERPITDLRTYRYNMERLAQTHAMDKACLDGARLFFRCRSIELVSLEGYHQPVATPPRDYDVPSEVYSPVRHHERMARHARSLTHPRWVDIQLTSPVQVGRRAVTFYGVSKDLYLLGYTEDEIRRLILQSPTYAGGDLIPATRRKLDDAIRSGIKKVERELATAARSTNGRK